MSKVKLRIAVESVMAGIRELAGPVIEDFVRETYLDKSRGDRDATGRRWKETRRSREEEGLIMILTRALLDSLTLVQTADGWRLEFRDVEIDRKKFALAKRPAWPNPNDPVWRGVLAKRLTEALRVKLRVVRG